MPINIPKGLPAQEILSKENIFAIDQERAQTQDIRPLKFVILNLMPKKIETETQLLRLLSKTPLQIDVDFLKISSHESKNTSEEHLLKFYETFSQIKNNFYDGMIITGAPLEHLDFSEVDYWDEFCEIVDWSKKHVFSTMYICWGAQAGLYHNYDVNKIMCPKKVFGIYPQTLYKHNFLMSGFDELFNMPHSRHTKIDEEKLKTVKELEIMAGSDEVGSSIICTKNLRQIYIPGHLEYVRLTLAQEYFRDKEAGKEIDLPYHYFPDNNPDHKPAWVWKSHANLLYRNWTTYIYQMTPYDLTEIENLDE